MGNIAFTLILDLDLKDFWAVESDSIKKRAGERYKLRRVDVQQIKPKGNII